jgi:hypothetical protein
LANLAAICNTKALVSKNHGAAAGIAYQSIAHTGAQGARAVKAVPNPPGGIVHDYVPFYFAPRSPMLYAIHGGQVANCQWRQQDIIYFETTVDQALVGDKPFVFYDRNATLAFSIAHTDLTQLDTAVAWDLFTEAPCLDGFCKYWQNRPSDVRYVDRMERRQAEFLIYRGVALSQMTRIGVFDAGRQQQAQVILTQYGVNLPVDVMPSWYF